jgi:putative ATP-dependent endonuclease of the OLD family
MDIVRIAIRNFRCVKDAVILPVKSNVLLGPNNIGKTAVLEALNLVLNPEMGSRWKVIDENDFSERQYLPLYEVDETPCIRIELVLAGMTDDDENTFWQHIVPWRADTQQVVESVQEGADPFENAVSAIRVVFEGWYDPDEDEFDTATYFLRESSLNREECASFTKEHKRHIGFLIYRDFRALTRPISLEYGNLFNTLLRSQKIQPKHFEEALRGVNSALDSMAQESDFAELLSAYKTELELFLPLAGEEHPDLRFELTDLTRDQVKAASQLYVSTGCGRPIQKMGAGSRSLALLAVLTLIMRRRGSGILALEEPETFLYPHAQRRVIDECLSLASQMFVTTHSPFVLERMPVESVGRVENKAGSLTWRPMSTVQVKQINLYSKRLRQVHCEALMGRGVIVVEGDSDRWWLTGASNALNGQTRQNRRHEALELQGISVVSADTNGDIHKLSRFFHESGLRTIALFDNTNDPALVTEALDAQYPSFFFQANGLEEVLAKHLPIAVIRQMLSKAPHSRTQLLDETTVNALPEPDVRQRSKAFLIANKGSGPMHSWLIEEVQPSEFPAPLCSVCSLASAYMTQHEEMGVCTLRC